MAYAQNDSIRFALKPIDRNHFADGTRVYHDSAIYQGMNIRLDIANSILEPARSKGKIQNYEIALNVRLKQRLYPTLELGYAMAETGADGGQYKGQGGFLRAGMDINPLKKHPERLSFIGVGIRVGTAYQRYDLTDVETHSTYWPNVRTSFINQGRCDVWGEIVAGVQVQIWAGFHMGWAARLKFMFTETDKKNYGPLPYYVPGFGYRDNQNWGVNYYLGWKF